MEEIELSPPGLGDTALKNPSEVSENPEVNQSQETKEESSSDSESFETSSDSSDSD